MTIIVIPSDSEDDNPQHSSMASPPPKPQSHLPMTSRTEPRNLPDEDENSFADYSDAEFILETDSPRKDAPIFDLDSSDDEYNVVSGVIVW